MWDASARLDIPMPKDTNAYVKLDVYNILNSDNAVSISSSGYLEYDAGRQFWLEVGYEW